MTPLFIEPFDSPVEPGNFSARVGEGALRLPRPLAALFLSRGVREAAEALALIEARGPELARELRWQPAELAMALSGLRRALRGAVPDELLSLPGSRPENWRPIGR